MELNEQHTTVNIVKFFKFSEEQRLVLRDFYAQNHYPNKQEIENLSNQFGCTKKQINSWFTNTRQVMRRRNDKKSEDSNNFDDEHLESSSEECEVIDAKRENFKEVMPEDQAASINETSKNVMVNFQVLSLFSWSCNTVASLHLSTIIFIGSVKKVK